VLRQRSISAIGIVLFAAIPAFVGGYVFAAAMLIIAILGERELMAAFSLGGHRPFRRLTEAAAATFLIVSAFRSTPTALVWLLLLLLLSMMTAMVFFERPQGILLDWSLSFSATIYVAVPLFFAVALRATTGASDQHWVNTVTGWFHTPAQGLAWTAIAISVTWLNDTAAYLFGRQFGRVKLAPRLSPGKTREGAAAGIVAGTLTAAGATWLFGASISLWVALGVGFVLSIAGQLGDLAESALKRSLGVKDMGALIPGHGGILDRVDALLFTFPVSYLLLQALVRIGWT
jgi:phosphatidate cytidylyltransferase